ncbi:alpha/beta hydrolase [Amycolatopsis sp. cmx-4-68]|uniref:alpha/beta hydrolase n=1 Tax=Amycolatopsis sp. cmx-4-68 TaxID=2790938 RepID=UPI00397978CD
MVALSDVKRWNTGQLDEIFQTVQQQLQVLTHSGDDFGNVMPVEGWSGPSAETAGSAHHSLMSRIDKMAAGASIVAKAIGQAADAITSVQHAITDAEALAGKYGYRIAEDGTVTDTFPAGHAPPDMHPEDRARIRAQVADAITEALRNADDIDADLASVLKRAQEGDFGTGDETTVTAAAADGARDPGLTLPEPPPNATPSQTAAWWNSQSPAGQAILLHDRPGALGAMDGIPADVRDKANRVVFTQQYDDLTRQRDDLQHRMDGLNQSDPTQQSEYFDLERQRDSLSGKLTGMDQISDRLTNPLPGQPHAYLLGLNPQNSGQAIIAIGNPDTAVNVATYVPGTTAGINDGMATDINRSDAMVQAAQRSGSPSTSVITWAGYDAPQTLVDAASTSYADHAETSLRRFQDGLGATHQPGEVNTTVIGHSYGTTVVGQTARDLGLPADNLVMVASPGVGVQHANDLRLDGVPPDQAGQHLYSTKAPTDPIPALTNFDNPAADKIDPLGPDPTTAWFGGQTFQSNSTNPLSSHGDYWLPRSDSLRSMGNVIAGGRP